MILPLSPYRRCTAPSPTTNIIPYRRCTAPSPATNIIPLRRCSAPSLHKKNQFKIYPL